MSNIEQQIKDAIEKDLPAQVGTVLKERLAKIEELEDKVEQQKKELKGVREDLKVAEKQLSNHVSIDTRQQSLNDREKEVQKRELKQDLIEAEKTAESQKVQLVKEMFDTVFRNSTVRKEVHRRSPQYVYDQQGNQTGMGYDDETIEETVE